MKENRIFKKSGIIIALVLFGFIFSQIIPGNMSIPTVQAKSVKKTVKKAKRAYEEKVVSLASDNETEVYYRIIDVTGDKIPELLTEYLKTSRHGVLQVYKYKKGKVKKILDKENENLTIYLYRKTKTLLIYNSYHSYNDRAYYKYSNGKFRLKAKRCCNSSAEVKKWYEKGNGSTISKKKYNRIIKKLKKGKKKNLHYYESWSRFPVDDEEDEDYDD